jgi:2-polyprenyl-3-methyl-5-hydroxy-6-metoxy-1,4-benzoquinol methylase
MERINLIYYGYVFDASGYGNAARSYIHALHEAGIQLSVAELARRGRQIPDELVESLLNKPIDADFHLFHGIPPQWARLAFRQSRGIGMTVWETDVMPSQWRSALNQMLEVWLPCEFNVSAFGNALERPVFRLPHPLASSSSNGWQGTLDELSAVPLEDYVFYSIFEWQDRKCPQGVLTAFLQAFTSADRASLVMKTNPGAAGIAHAAIDEARRSIRSDARVVVVPEGWSNPQIAALHARGDCYVSLHRGEGWNYPLFDAASRGKPVIATGYSGPMDYLNHSEHSLVRYRICAVRQPYLYYHPSMQWADPDLAHASELMRWTYEHQQEARSKAERSALTIRERFSTRSVGEAARTRLLALLRRTRPERWRQFSREARTRDIAPPVPIPGEWYDCDYFETGLKSNWTNGYSWLSFAGLFQDTARFLTTVFPDANSFLDVGAAKGFLVRCLREAGKEAWGIDFSSWAVRHADRCCAPFLQLTSAEAYPFEKQFDVVLAFSILESLTEPQILDFLERSKRAARSAILAVIACLDGDRPESALAHEDNDLSHITMRSRAWWDEQFSRAGWRHGPECESLQVRCQSAPLPVRMGWTVFVRTP